MNIVNIDVDYSRYNCNLVPKICEAFDFARKILEKARSKTRSPYYLEWTIYYPVYSTYTYPAYMFKEIDYTNVFDMLYAIDIKLRDRNSKQRNEEAIVDSLGAYFSNGNESPHIELYISDIKETAALSTNPNAFKWLFTKVLIHELAHATMDLHNWLGWYHYEAISYHTDFGKWREESMANALTLFVINKANNRAFYNYSKDFIDNNQPKEYALGIVTENLVEDEFYDYVIMKNRGVPQELQDDWLAFARKYPNIDSADLRMQNAKLYR